AIVEQARQPCWYAELGVPDTPEGRFEMVAWHAAMVMRRLRREGLPGQALGQQLFDVMFVDLDGGLRELGVSDLSVGTYVKRLAGNFYARMAALDEALGEPPRAATAESGQALYPALRDNIYERATPDDEQLATLANYVVEQDLALAGQDGAALTDGVIAWVDPPSAS
ncbi:MAG: ubiquinol-cytochrome C chaperone family protein, partial [Pseudomonadota bacterium]